MNWLTNAATRTLATMFPGYFGTAKHNHYADFGYPTDVTFDLAFSMYERNGIASAAIDKTIGKTWQDEPFVQEFQRDGTTGGDQGETPLEKDIRTRFAQLRVWQHLAEADRRGMVGAYAGVILRLADSKAFSEPVDRVGGGLLGLVEVIPAWEGQLTVTGWGTDERKADFGQPTMFQFSEAAVPGSPKQPRQMAVHPDRVVIWSKDGTLNGRSALKPGFNSLIDMEKISGAGGEGFWKNAKSAPVLEVPAEVKIAEMAKAMGVSVEDLVDKMNQQVEDWNKGFDKLLMLQGMKASMPQVNLPSPEHFFLIALQSFAASMLIPLKILVGSQTGERASTEDAEEWSQTNMARRTSQAIPNIMGLIERLVRFGILGNRDWHLEWTDLTETSMGEKIDRAAKMATVNQTMKDSGELIFTPEEIRSAVDLEPLSDADKFRDDDDDKRDAIDIPRKPANGEPDAEPALAA